jgi:hypothetical protein
MVNNKHLKQLNFIGAIPAKYRISPNVHTSSVSNPRMPMRNLQKGQQKNES